MHFPLSVVVCHWQHLKCIIIWGDFWASFGLVFEGHWDRLFFDLATLVTPSFARPRAAGLTTNHAGTAESTCCIFPEIKSFLLSSDVTNVTITIQTCHMMRVTHIRFELFLSDTAVLHFDTDFSNIFTIITVYVSD